MYIYIYMRLSQNRGLPPPPQMGGVFWFSFKTPPKGSIRKRPHTHICLYIHIFAFARAFVGVHLHRATPRNPRASGSRLLRSMCPKKKAGAGSPKKLRDQFPQFHLPVPFGAIEADLSICNKEKDNAGVPRPALPTLTVFVHAKLVGNPTNP